MTEFIDAIERFRKDYPDPECVGFLMMRFSTKSPYLKIEETVKDAFKEQGIVLLRADDIQYSPDLLTNIQVYMHGCGFGVAIFDRIADDEFNPNISLELGFMMALNKPVFILKDETLKSLPSDLVSRLYTNFDIHDPQKGLYKHIQKWMESNEINPCRCKLTMYMQLGYETWGKDNEALIEGIPMLVPKAGKPKFCGARLQEEKWAFDFDASERFAEKIKELYETGDLDRLAGLEIAGVTVKNDIEVRNVDYVFQDVVENDTLVQICLLSYIDSLEQEAKEAMKVLPSPVADRRECAIYITKTEDQLYYFHSNYIIPGHIHPTKILAVKFNGLNKILPLVLGQRNKTVFNDDKLTLDHVKHVRYIFNKRLMIDDKPPFDTFGAQNIEFVDF